MMSHLSFFPSRLTLGTVQIGLPYGAANRSGCPDEVEAEAILDRAMAGGITTLDTARAYGLAEERIGRWLAARGDCGAQIVTKIPPLPAGSPSERRSAFDAALATSLTTLGRRRLELVLAHHETDLLDPSVVAAFEAAVTDGRIAAYGASVYSPDSALDILRTVPIAALQLPISAVDRRFVQAGVIAAAIERKVAVFARSIFLQGVLLIDPDHLPAHLSALAGPVRALRAIASSVGRSLSEILLAAVRDTPGVTSIVIGVERAEQLEPHLLALASPSIVGDVGVAMAEAVRAIPAETIDPSRWPKPDPSAVAE